MADITPIHPEETIEEDKATVPVKLPEKAFQLIGASYVNNDGNLTSDKTTIYEPIWRSISEVIREYLGKPMTIFNKGLQTNVSFIVTHITEIGVVEHD